MSRSGYHDDLDILDLGRWRGQVASAIRGKRGQAFLKEMIEALDALPEKRLIKNEIVEGCEVCALGAVGKKRGLDLDSLDPHDHDGLGNTFGVAHQLVQEIEWENDEGGWNETPEQRWTRVRAWVSGQLRSTT